MIIEDLNNCPIWSTEWRKRTNNILLRTAAKHQKCVAGGRIKVKCI